MSSDHDLATLQTSCAIMSVSATSTPEAGASAAALTTSGTSTWKPLSAPKGGRSGPIVTLPVPLGAHAAQTEKDMAAARQRTAFDTKRIEDVLRDGRIDNETRLNMIRVLDNDELFCDWKKRM